MNRPGRYFVARHDRRVEAMIIREQYGSIAAFVLAHGYGPDLPMGGQPD